MRKARRRASTTTFFNTFGVKRSSVARYEEHVRKLDNRSGFIDLFWPGVLLVEQKSAGRDLTKAYEQAGDYFDALPEQERPRYILVSDFQTFELHDLDERERAFFALADLPQHVEKFGFILGIQKRTFKDQDPVNIQASELMGHLHDALEHSGYTGHDLELFLVRTVFCLFADDTGIFEPRDIFLDFLETRTSEDGADLGRGWPNSSRYWIRQRQNARPRWTKIWRLFPTSMANYSGSRRAFRPLLRPCGSHCLTPADLTGLRSLRQFSVHCSNRSWKPQHVESRVRITPPSGIF